MNEPTTALTDYVLALLAAFLGARMLRVRPGRYRPEEREPKPSLARRLWAFSFLAVAVAAALGGTWHALAPETLRAPRAAGALWSATYLAAGVANLLMLVGVARAALPEATQAGAIRLLKVVVGALTALTLWRRDLLYLGAGFGITLLLLLAFGLVLLHYRERAAGFMVAGALVSLAGGFVIVLRLGLHPQFNHNGLFHVIQMASIGLLYKAGLELRDRVSRPRPFERYVAIGDSSTEGLDDPDGSGGFRGWADRLAERIAARQAGLLYANLAAIRGRRARDVREQQLERAVAMRPDLATVFAGTNDVVRPRCDVHAVAADVGWMQRRLVDCGATVLTLTLPDLAPVLPLARSLSARLRAFNDALRRKSADAGAIVVDLAAHRFASDPRLWSEDRFHANAVGHERIAGALLHALGLADDASWAEPLPAVPASAWHARRAADLRWAGRFFLPWLWRHARGRSSGDGRREKRPALLPLQARRAG